MKAALGKTLTSLLTLGFMLGLVWSFLFMSFVEGIKSRPQGFDPADGLVVLTGGTGRVDEGFSLLAEGRGKRLLISGINQELDIKIVMNDIGNDPALKACCVDAENISTDTRSNAEQVLAWAEVNNFKSILLITSDYHMPRTLLIFQQNMPNVKIIPHPVHSEIPPFKLAMEFNKYLLSLAATWLTS